MKPELLVIADQNAAVNTFSNFALTARQFKGAGNTLRPRFIMWATVGSVTGNKSLMQSAYCDLQEQSY
ncbi:MAG: hypothetical protein A3A13_03420 [Candidatus Yanofskybacteria bacterium RIFCSPLOWO2_01_FULL_43_22]|uniref:Uncharacterized protein n=1 Tax=Candidatus Yanofskybacteria bacterium RIFCSPLOWO2_01_FULL_43_22 TaxID=1802695 RepID=A0A1F8GJ98_9BACT|nr:MAG: hypothetical protein A3A13_03420 [Candidatus Yanofskybacteria bacterium RIFCSPLOWO2_01_FULL_43_22]